MRIQIGWSCLQWNRQDTATESVHGLGRICSKGFGSLMATGKLSVDRRQA